MHQTPTNQEGTSVLASLRALMPDRPLQLAEALKLAELQANRLLRLRGVDDLPVPTKVVSGLPRIIIEPDPELPAQAASGASDWDSHRRAWVISINPSEPATRQRFTVLHKYKHILDHYRPRLARPLPATVYGLDPVEYVADYFAGCVLMPKRLVKAAYFDGIQRASDLAELFDVSPRAMQVRLDQLGLTRVSDEPPAQAPRSRSRPPVRRPGTPARYHRPLSRTPFVAARIQEAAV